MSVVETVLVSVIMFVVWRPLLNIVGFFSLECGGMLYVCVKGVIDIVFSVCIMTRGAVGVRSVEVLVLLCRCCMFVSCVHRVAVLNVVFCMTCSLLMLVEDARYDHMERHTPELVS